MTPSRQRASVSLEPLARLVETQLGPELTTESFARLCKTTSHAIDRWRNNGTIPWVSADEAAIAIGLHPVLVWGDEWLNVKGDFDAICAEVSTELEQEMVNAITAEGLED